MNDNEGEMKIPEILSTHPASETRAHDLEKIMPEASVFILNIFFIFEI
jgi:hypothetical protein